MMAPLTIEPTYRVLLGDVDRFRAMIIGAGGTGSSLALFLAGLAYHARQKGIAVELTLVDHDLVEPANCGRQALSVQAATAGNVPKVCDLALRLNAAYGLAICAWPERFEAGMAEEWLREGGGYDSAHLLIGCVDNHLARREIAAALEQARGRLWGIDCGNERISGQVLIGNLPAEAPIRLDPLGLCSGLPSPYIQEPAILEPDPEPHAPSCAVQAQGEAQSLMVNRMAATIAAQITADFVLKREISVLSTVFTLNPPTARSRQITRSNLGPFLS